MSQFKEDSIRLNCREIFASKDTDTLEVIFVELRAELVKRHNENKVVG